LIYTLFRYAQNHSFTSSLLREKAARGFVHDSLRPGRGDAVRHSETARENMKGFMFNTMWNLLMHGGIMQDCKMYDPNWIEKCRS
jgi:hypothetical protein